MQTAARYRFGDPVAHSFGLAGTRTLVTRPLQDAELGFTRISLTQAHLGRTPQIPEQDAFVCAVYLTDLPYHELWSRGRAAVAQGYAANSMRIVNLAQGYAAHVFHPHEALSINIPRAMLDELSADAGIGRVGTLACEPGHSDPVLHHLIAALMPAILRPAEASALFVDHLGLALCAHLAKAHGDARHWERMPKGGLSPFQERRAKEVLASRIGGDVSLDDVAAACDLSRGHLSRAFKVSTGFTLHQWVQQRRIAHAKEALRRTDAPIAEVALACGFADQSHLTRVFSRLVGVSPAAWRRQHARRVPPD